MAEKALGAMQTQGLPGLWAPSPSSCPPHQEKARAGKPTPMGLQIKDWQRWDSARLPCAGRPFSPCAKATPARPSTPTPFRKSPRPRPPRGLSPAADRTLSYPQRDLSGWPRRRGARRCAPASRGGGRKLPRTKELSAKRCGNFGVRGDARVPGAFAGAQVETWRGGVTPGRSSARTRPGEAQTFPQGPCWLAPLAAL